MISGLGELFVGQKGSLSEEDLEDDGKEKFDNRSSARP